MKNAMKAVSISLAICLLFMFFSFNVFADNEIVVYDADYMQTSITHTVGSYEVYIESLDGGVNHEGSLWACITSYGGTDFYKKVEAESYDCDLNTLDSFQEYDNAYDLLEGGFGWEVSPSPYNPQAGYASDLHAYYRVLRTFYDNHHELKYDGWTMDKWYVYVYSNDLVRYIWMEE